MALSWTLVAGCVAVVSAGAMAQSIPIVNADFESPAMAPGGFTQDGLPGWSPVGSIGAYGVFYPTVASWGYTAPQGNQLLYINTGTVEQSLPALALFGETYQLDVSVIYRPVYGTRAYVVELFAGDVLLGRDDSTLQPEVGAALTSTISYTVGANDPAIGQPLRIRLGGGNQVNFDDVRLSGVPGPGVLSAVGVLGLCVGRRRRAR